MHFGASSGTILEPQTGQFLGPRTGQFPEKIYSLTPDLRSIIFPENKEYNFVFCNKIGDYTPYPPGKLYSLSPGVKEYNFS